MSAAQASFGKCNEDWMAAGGYCAASCSRCSHPFTIDGRGSANGPGLAPSGVLFALVHHVQLSDCANAI